MTSSAAISKLQVLPPTAKRHSALVTTDILRNLYSVSTTAMLLYDPGQEGHTDNMSWLAHRLQRSQLVAHIHLQVDGVVAAGREAVQQMG
jgi:hypothetical protein